MQLCFPIILSVSKSGFGFFSFLLTNAYIFIHFDQKEKKNGRMERV